MSESANIRNLKKKYFDVTEPATIQTPTTTAIAEDESFGVVVDARVLLDGECKTVDGVCLKVERKYYALYKRHGYVFTFAIFNPEKYSKTDLEMHVPYDLRWKKRIPPSSKLYKLLCVALGRHPRRGESLHPETFLNQAFRCLVKVTGAGPSSYSEIDTLTERLTGKYSR
jgi:hypothetical protein